MEIKKNIYQKLNSNWTLSPGKVLARFVVRHPLRTSHHPTTCMLNQLERCCRYKAKPHRLAHSKHAPLAILLLLFIFSKQYIQTKDSCRDVYHPLHQPQDSLLKSPQTLAPLSWSASVGPVQTTAISPAPCLWLCRRGETPPCPASLCPLPSPRAIPPRMASTLSRVCEMIFLWTTCGKKIHEKVVQTLINQHRDTGRSTEQLLGEENNNHNPHCR